LELQAVTPFLQDADFTLYVGDVRECLRELPAESVHCCVTSPPYWGLRDYGSEGQIGLEPTPEAFVAAMVDVFREVRRVLRADGSLWLNLGDSYAGSWGNYAPGGIKGEQRARTESGERWERPGYGNDTTRKPPTANAPGLKPKDLVGIPWRVAFALQQPYYTGRIKDEADRLWLAAMVDTEGCIHIHKRSAGAKSHTHTLVSGEKVDYERKTDTYGVMVSIDNTSKALIDRIEAIVGQGSRYTHEKGVGKSNRKQTLYRITLTGQQSRELLRELYPHLVAKQQEARIAYHSPSSGAGAEEAWQAIKALHNGEPTTGDYPEPPTLFEPGWYLRSDVIWGKPNPMPESVTDRPTKAHEYVFLLTKSPRYFFDQEAVREKYADPAREWWDEPATTPGNPNRKDGGGVTSRPARGPDGRKVTRVAGATGSIQHRDGERWPNGGRNIRSVWEIATQPYPDAHFATFPEALPDRCIRAGTSERGCCPVCGAPWEREVERGPQPPEPAHRNPGKRLEPGQAGNVGAGNMGFRASRLSGQEMARWRAAHPDTTTGWRPMCACNHTPVPCTVLDPFMGSGTTALVARKLGRRSIGIELNREYARLAARRLQQQSLFAGDAA
jgi:DNA modification methylase